jgi:hypothetical protein
VEETGVSGENHRRVTAHPHEQALQKVLNNHFERIFNISRIISTPGWSIRIEYCSHVCDGFNILMVDIQRRLITELYKIYYNT